MDFLFLSENLSRWQGATCLKSSGPPNFTRSSIPVVVGRGTPVSRPGPIPGLYATNVLGVFIPQRVEQLGRQLGTYQQLVADVTS